MNFTESTSVTSAAAPPAPAAAQTPALDVQLTLENNRLRQRKDVPMQAAVALAPGQLLSADGLCLLDEDGCLPAQFTPLAAWPDGSVKWLLIDFLANLDVRQTRRLRLSSVDAAFRATERPRVRVEATADGAVIDTGPLRLTIAGQGPSLLSKVCCDGCRLPLSRIGACIVTDDGRTFATDGPRQIVIEEAGPVRAVVRIDGRHRDANGDHCMRWRVRVHAYAGDRVIGLDYALINSEPALYTALRRVTLTLEMDQDAAVRSGSQSVPSGWRQSVGQDYRIRTFAPDGQQLAMALPRENVPPLSITCGDGGWVAQLIHFTQQLPKAWRATDQGVELDLWPQGQLLQYPRGTGKMHELKLAFFSPTFSRDQAAARLAMHDEPPRAAADVRQLAASGAVPDLFTAGLPAGRYPRIEMAIKDVFLNRDQFYGMMHWGDDVGWGYTNAGRGKLDTTTCDAGITRPIYNNLEYDFPCVAFHQYLRSGETYYFEQGRSSALHMMHVDFLHAYEGATDPLSYDGVALHVTDHTGRSGWTPCHTWVGGLLRYHLLTGSHEAREKAEAIGRSLHWFVHSEHGPRCMNEPGRLSREYGWGLIAACDLYDLWHNPRDLQTARTFADLIRQWEQRDARLCHNGFCIAVCLNGLARYLAIDRDPAVEQLFQRLLDTLMTHFRLPQGLIAFSDTETRSGCHGRRWGHGICAARALAFAHERTGDQRYLRQGLRELAYLLDSGLFRQYVFPAQLHVGVQQCGADAVHDQTAVHPVGMREIAQHLRELFPLLEAADAAGLLAAIDYPY